MDVSPMGLWAQGVEFVFADPVVGKQSGQEFQGYGLSKPLCPWMTLGKCINFSPCKRKVIVLSPPF